MMPDKAADGINKPAASDALTISHLYKNYGSLNAVSDLSLRIGRGEIYGFIGPNGAGKSTTIRCIMGLLSYKGSIFLYGQSLDKDNLGQKRKIGYLPSEVSLYEEYTIKRMLAYAAGFFRADFSARIDYLLKRLNLDPSRRIRDLSLGNLKKTGLVLALLHDPSLIVLDEPTSGLDPLAQEAFFDLLAEEKKKGSTILFSTHNLSEIKRICDHVAIIKKGRIIKAAAINDLTAEKSVIVTVKAGNIASILKTVGFDKIIERGENSLRALYQGNINALIRKLSAAEVSRLLIQEPSIEDIFMNYYADEEGSSHV